MKRKPIIRCKICGEETCNNRKSSFYGHVHKWGPTAHKFVPDYKPPKRIGE